MLCRVKTQENRQESSLKCYQEKGMGNRSNASLKSLSGRAVGSVWNSWLSAHQSQWHAHAHEIQSWGPLCFLQAPGSTWDSLVAIIPDGLCDQGYKFTSNCLKTKEGRSLFCFLPSPLHQHSSGKVVESWSFKKFSSSISFQPCKRDFSMQGRLGTAEVLFQGQDMLELVMKLHPKGCWIRLLVKVKSILMYEMFMSFLEVL